MQPPKDIKKKQDEDEELNADWQGVDKDPEEEKGKKEKVTMDDLKGKAVDEDPEEESGRPIDRS